MEQEFKPTPEPVEAPRQQEVKIDPSNIKNQYSQMHQEQQERTGPTDEEIEQNRKREQERLDQDLPFLRDSAEFSRLQVELITNDFRMGKVPANRIPGPLGKALEVEQLDLQMRWAELKMDQNNMMKRAQEEKLQLERKQEQEKDKGRNVTVVFDKEFPVTVDMVIPAGKEYIVSGGEDIKVEISIVETPEHPAGTETRSFNIHKLEDTGIVHIVR